MDDCRGVTIASLEGLMSTAVQGCWLKVRVEYCEDLSSVEACSQMRQQVLSQRGARDTPGLTVVEWSE
jgi:hypothetical protein